MINLKLPSVKYVRLECQNVKELEMHGKA